ncbi:tyrosine-protein phosphatase [Paenibacillus abyssi]|uniref:Tyrosine-protein phosphatase n=1 Tax=Paenibacillus abyssi TaxID=1340531 RepID=A0A917G462_9BACL|nr:CpsB/CapC family capsule biosynthesis tyrosine phosphatase [Paenibacillus abyssi]GGG21772.1 tyrosine protein phosphatase [Paenibacillus abyssi]
MIDIHTHILPGLDDGAESMEEALEMARIAADQGIRSVIATPHHLNGRYDTPMTTVNEMVEKLNHEIKKHHIQLQVKAGQEIRVHHRFAEELYQGRIGSLNDSRYILLELPDHQIPEILDEVLHEILVDGMTPIIAHPERNVELAAHPEKLAELIGRGVLCQLTAHSLIGLFGKQAQKTSLHFCKSRLIHFIASDAHNPYRRSFALKEAYKAVHRLLGPQYADYYDNNASRVLRDEVILVEEPELVKRRALFWW